VNRCLLVAVVAIGLMAESWAVAVASAGGTSPARRVSVRTSYYLALGDSVAVATGASSYPYLIARDYQRKLPGLRLDDIAVAGATTGSMQGGQYTAARRFLEAHRGHIALITIDIGGNDVAGCFGPGGVNDACFSHTLATVKHNLASMLAGLRKAAPGARVIGMSYYNPFLGYWLAGGVFRSFALSTVSAGIALNHELTALYGGPKKTADVQGAFRATDLTTTVASRWGEVPIAVNRACSWLAIQCHVGAPEGFGLDPNADGEAQIAAAFERTIGALRAPGLVSGHSTLSRSPRRATGP
jgi:GDSL-like Lipase/Acylhydrolase family